MLQCFVRADFADEFAAAVVDVNSGAVVSLFFRGVDQRDVPRGSTVKW